MTPSEWRERVGRHLEARRLALGYSSRYQICEGVELSEPWIRQMETGEVRRNDGTITAPNPRGNKVRLLMAQLQWPSDAIARLLAGEAPELLEVEPTERPPWEELLEGQRRVSETVERLADLFEERFPE